MPGNHIPILAPAHLLEDQPDYLLILAWNFAPEIMRQQQAYRQNGGRFIVPIPNTQILSESENVDESAVAASRV
jgi:hypothetical protein